MSSNDQPKERIQHSSGAELDIQDIFYTIQGEGPFSGHRALFIRLAGCNFQCPACDTDYTSTRKRMSVDEILDEMANREDLCHDDKLVVITGGEPFRQSISMLANTLLKTGYHVQVETNGSVPFPSDLSKNVHIVCSPKSKSIPRANLARIDSFKYVLDHRNIDPGDMLPLFALEHIDGKGVARPPVAFSGPVYVLPMDTPDVQDYYKNVQACKNACLEYGRILQFQIHKILEVK